jgi:hypothetical protein
LPVFSPVPQERHDEAFGLKALLRLLSLLGSLGSLKMLVFITPAEFVKNLEIVVPDLIWHSETKEDLLA